MAAASKHGTGSSAAGLFRTKRGRRASLSRRISAIETRLTAAAEVKNHSYPWATAASTAPLIYDTTAIASGTSEADRIGLSVNLVSLRLRIRMDSEGPSEANAWRVIVFRWDSDSYPGGGDIITPPSGAWAVLPNAIDRPANETTGPKYRILLDKNITIDDSAETRVLDWYYRFPKSARVEFKNSTATSGVKGRIFVALMCDSVAIPHPGFGGYTTIKYLDS